MHNNEIEAILKETGLSETELIFKSNVKKLRKNYPGSPSIMDMSKALGINYGTYRLIESYTPINVKFETMEKIARFYNIPVKELFSL